MSNTEQIQQVDPRPSIEHAEWLKFVSDFNKRPSEDTRRFGQSFHQHFSLEKSTALKDVADRIYYGTDRRAVVELILNTFDIS